MKYKENYQIGFSDCDEMKRLKLSTLIELLMQVSNDQLSHNGIGINDLIKQKLGWVVTQYHIEISRMPRSEEKVVLVTEAKGYNRFFEYRDYSIETPDGKELVKVTSQWVIIDLNKRKIVSPQPEMMARIEAKELKKLPRFIRLLPLEKYDTSKSYRVQYYDLDTNRHMTNSHYFDWLVDALERDFLDQHEIKTVEIKFDNEITYGSEPIVETKVKKDDEFISYHRISLGEETAAVAQISWE